MTHFLDASLVDWSRAQFALTAMYHWLFVPLTIGLGLLVAILETIYCRTGSELWLRVTKFWMRLFGVNFAIGVATGIILEFEFGTNWSNYSWLVGDIFGAPLAIEGVVAFFMETTFIAVMFFGWRRVSRGFHLAATWLTSIGTMISAWWILCANAWMQHPVGMTLNAATMRFEMTSFLDVALSPWAVVKFSHTVLSGWMTGAVFMAGVSAWLILRRRSVAEAKASIGVAAVFGLLATLGVALTGDVSGTTVARDQPMKLAAFEGLERGAAPAPFSIVPGVEVPGLLSVLATHDANAFVPGMLDILDGGYTLPDGTPALSAEAKMREGRRAVTALAATRAAKDEATHAASLREFEATRQYFGYGHVQDARELLPPATVLYWAFRLMTGLGAAFIAMFAALLWLRHKDWLERWPWLLAAVACSVPLVYVAGQAGWVCAELGRQPWAIQDLLPLSAAVSALPTAGVQLTFFLFAALFTLLLVAEIRIMLGIIRKGM